MHPEKGLVVNKWSLSVLNCLFDYHGATPEVCHLWLVEPDLSHVSLSSCTAQRVGFTPACLCKRAKKYTSCIMSSNMPFYWESHGRPVKAVLFLSCEGTKAAHMSQNEVYKNARCRTFYLHHLWCLTWIQHVLHERRRKKKNPAACCATIRHRGGQVMQGCLQRLLQKLLFAAEVYACALDTLRLFTLDSSQMMVIIENIFQTQRGVLLTESRTSSLCTQHVFFFKKSKCQTGKSGFIKPGWGVNPKRTGERWH